MKILLGHTRQLAKHYSSLQASLPPVRRLVRQGLASIFGGESRTSRISQMIRSCLSPNEPETSAVRTVSRRLRHFLAIWLFLGLGGVTLSQTAENSQYDAAMGQGDAAMNES